MRRHVLQFASAVFLYSAACAVAAADEPVRAGTDWWSLQPIARPAVPAVKATDWPRNPIDAFILAKLEQHGLAPAPPADRLTLVRRLYLDLIGLPPTPQEIDAFLGDPAPDAFEQLVDRLLASPHYGERWGRHWLDVARYGESDGFENDKPREHAWHYRDYVIRSLNADKPYDQFVKEQLAGDVIEPVTRDGIVASGFLVAGPWDEIQNVAKSPTERKRAHEEQIEELVAAVSQTFLGLTVQCARCHDHKFDPIPQSDYYSLKAVFDGVDHGSHPLMTPDERRAHERSLDPLRKRAGELKDELARLAAQLPGDAITRLANPRELMTQGRFGGAIDARKGHAETRGKTAYQTPPITVECWTQLSGKAGFNVLVANNVKDSIAHWEIYTYAGTGEFSAFLPGYEPAEIKSGVDITDGNWHFVAMTMDGSTVRLYVDGKLVKESAVRRRPDGRSASTGSLYFGGYPPQKIGCNGVVDDVRISRGLREIAGIPREPLVGDEQTIGLWRFDELDGSRFTDVTSAITSDARADLRQVEVRLAGELKQLEADIAGRAVPQVYSGTRRQPEPTHLLLRGDIHRPGPRVHASAISRLPGVSPDLALEPDAPESARRIRFAEWLVRPDHPLTARVLVNRVWQYHFGAGLVDTPSDFGSNGGRPSHPELLDWLASEFRSPHASDPAGSDPSPIAWSIKRLHRLIVCSATYRQSSRVVPAVAELDADNRLLARFPARRLEAEPLRDAILAVGGNLNREMGGPSFQPFTITIRNTYFYHLYDSDEPRFNRRTVYRMNVNTGRDPLLDALDCPSPSITMPKRRSTITPPHALSLMNDPFVTRQSGRFAERVRGEEKEVASQIRLAFRLALGREPGDGDFELSRQLVEANGLESLCWALLNSSEFLYVR